MVVAGIVGGAAYDLVKAAVSKAYAALAARFGSEKVTLDDDELD